MTGPPSDPGGGERDGRLAAVLAGYLAAREDGRPVDRDALVAAHPDLADELLPLLDSVDAVSAASRAVAAGDAGAGVDPLLPAEAVLGDYRVVRPVGRGGMGVVYEAEDTLLGRRVALKVLPAAAAADPAARRQFFREARAGTLLRHPHVVPVYAVGGEGGVPFIAMRFVDGASLDRVVRALRRSAGLDPPADVGEDPPGAAEVAAGLGDPRSAGYIQRVAGLGAQAADALAFAHDAGVVHRDLKPGNLLLDTAGHLWLSDFGLARAAVLPAGAASSGGRPGTLRYMSPEQAAGGKAGEPADVYGLGATLYELLALRPAFPAADPAELLPRVIGADPDPPRRHNPAVPEALETVVLQAMAKDPRDRYPSAAGLAADLRRFLAGTPVEARRPTRLHRWWRQAERRKKPLAALGLALAVGLVLGLSGSTYLVWRAYRAERAERGRADRREGLLRDLIAGYEGLERDLRHRPGGGGQHRGVVRGLKAAWCALADEPGARAGDRLAAVRACVRLAEVEDRAGDGDARAAAYAEAGRRLAPLLAADPRNPDYRRERAGVAGYEAARTDPEADPDRWRALTHESLELYEGLAGDDPGRAEYRARVCGALGALADHHLGRGEAAAALALAGRAVGVADGLLAEYPTGHPLSYMRLVWAWQRVARARSAGGDPAGAEAALRAAVGYDDRLAAEHPAVRAGVRADTVMARAELAALLVARGRYDEARPLLEWAAGEFGRLSAEHPTDAVFPRHLAGCRLWLGQLEYLAGRADAARAAFGGMAEALRGRPGGPPVSLWPPLTPLVPVPGVFDPRADAAELSAASRGVGGRACRVPLGWALLRAGRYREAAGVLDAEFARDPSPVAERAVAGYGLVVCHVKLGDLAAARRAWEGAEGLDGLRYATDGRVRIARQEAGAALGLAGR